LYRAEENKDRKGKKKTYVKEKEEGQKKEDSYYKWTFSTPIWTFLAKYFSKSAFNSSQKIFLRKMSSFLISNPIIKIRGLFTDSTSKIKNPRSQRTGIVIIKCFYFSTFT